MYRTGCNHYEAPLSTENTLRRIEMLDYYHVNNHNFANLLIYGLSTFHVCD